MLLNLLIALIGRITFFTGLIGARSSFLPPLSKEEEEKYLKLSAKGDKQAKDILVRHNMRLVAHIVKKYVGAGEADDLISVGTIGLIKAINTYKSEHGTVLATYTARCIENEILMYIRANKKHKNTLSLTEPVGTDKEGNELTLMDLLFEKEEDVFDEAEKSVIRDKFVKRIRECLNEREFTVLSLRYGLDGRVPLTQRETAQNLKISRSYISRIEKKSILKLKECLVKEEYL